MNEATPAICVIDGDTMHLPGGDIASDAKTQAAALLDAPVLLLRNARAPRKQRLGPQALVEAAMADMIVYAFPGAPGKTLPAEIDSLLTPFDRYLSSSAEARADALTVPGNAPADCLKVVREDLSHRAPDAQALRALIEQKRRHVDLRAALGSRLTRLAALRKGSNRPLGILHDDAGAGEWSAIANGLGARYFGVCATAKVAEAALARAPGATFAARTGLSLPPRSLDCLLLTGEAADAFDPQSPVLAAFAAAAGRPAHALAALSISEAGGGHPALAHLNAIGAAIGRACAGHADLCHMSALAHKPHDLAPSAIVAEFEVGR